MKRFQPTRRGGTRGCCGLSGLGKNRSRCELHGCNSRYGCSENEATLAVEGFRHQFSEINRLTCEALDSETKIAKAVHGNYTAKVRELLISNATPCRSERSTRICMIATMTDAKCGSTVSFSYLRKQVCDVAIPRCRLWFAEPAGHTGCRPGSSAPQRMSGD